MRQLKRPIFLLAIRFYGDDTGMFTHEEAIDRLKACHINFGGV